MARNTRHIDETKDARSQLRSEPLILQLPWYRFSICRYHGCSINDAIATKSISRCSSTRLSNNENLLVFVVQVLELFSVSKPLFRTRHTSFCLTQTPFLMLSLDDIQWMSKEWRHSKLRFHCAVRYWIHTTVIVIGNLDYIRHVMTASTVLLWAFTVGVEMNNTVAMSGVLRWWKSDRIPETCHLTSEGIGCLPICTTPFCSSPLLRLSCRHCRFASQPPEVDS